MRPVPGKDPAGYAELFVGLWLNSGQESQGSQSAAAKAVRAMAPKVELPQWGEAPPKATQVAAVDSERLHSRAWSVTVAAQFESADVSEDDNSGTASGEWAAVRFFTVPVVMTADDATSPGGRQALAVAAAPAEVAGPQTAELPASPYGTDVEPGSALEVTVREFLSAYLSGDGGVDRYLAPGAVVAAPSAPYTAVRVERVSAADGTGDRPVEDGAQARVRAQVTAGDTGGGQWPLSYALRLTARDGRWEIAEVEAGLEISRKVTR
ncbi:conjugal transfer protein [Streptomyces megasporus]|uniref:conjugal transfer protein n=1 Tax=Streptomyces megasporus TaxID=44060 RepID=UPI0012FEEB03|nr:conjugal transfer protein [Streptomyces megasporus]